MLKKPHKTQGRQTISSYSGSAFAQGGLTNPPKSFHNTPRDSVLSKHEHTNSTLQAARKSQIPCVMQDSAVQHRECGTATPQFLRDQTEIPACTPQKGIFKSSAVHKEWKWSQHFVALNKAAPSQRRAGPRRGSCWKDLHRQPSVREGLPETQTPLTSLLMTYLEVAFQCHELILCCTGFSYSSTRMKGFLLWTQPQHAHTSPQADTRKSRDAGWKVWPALSTFCFILSELLKNITCLP